MTILNEYDKIPIGVFIMMILCIACCIAGLAYGITEYIKVKSLADCIFGLSIAILCGISIAAAIAGFAQNKFTQHYVEAQIDNRYPVNKLLGKYNIVEVRGHIYVLEEKAKKKEIIDDNYG